MSLRGRCSGDRGDLCILLLSTNDAAVFIFYIFRHTKATRSGVIHVAFLPVSVTRQWCWLFKLLTLQFGFKLLELQRDGRNGRVYVCVNSMGIKSEAKGEAALGGFCGAQSPKRQRRWRCGSVKMSRRIRRVRPNAHFRRWSPLSRRHKCVR